LTYQYVAKLDQHFDWIVVDKLLPSIFQKFLKAVDLQALSPCSDGLKALAGLILAGAAERLIAPSERRASSASIFAI